MTNNKLVAPIVKWVGGKRQLLDILLGKLPQTFDNYCEPFVGGGALLFKLQPAKAIINDINAELINVYHVVKEDVEGLIAVLQQFKNEAGVFYRIRDWDRDKEKYQALTPTEKAARILYLNKTCYNGLFRVNSSGEFNTPFGTYKNPNIVNAAALRAVSLYFNQCDITLHNTDYASILAGLTNNYFVYLDPPYDPVSDTANFTGYTKGGFDKTEQTRLKECCDALNKKGVQFLLSNSATPFILDLYKDYNLEIVQAKRMINSVSSKRGDTAEVIVRNYE